MPICGKHARRSRARRARPPWRPTLDVDESVAAAVLARVESPRDRLALACVSRVWRRASATAGAWGVWGTCDLVLDGELGEKVTDERFERLMLYCGDVKHLEVRDAPEGFEGVYLSGLNGPAGSLAAKFASLTTVVLTGCESVDGAHIVDLMRAIGMTSRPKKDRLRRLHLAGCQVDDDEVATLSECVRLGRLENYAACFREPHKEQDGIDVCVCLNCDDVMPMSNTYMCYSCLDTCCVDCAEENWGQICGGCPANVCDKDQCAVSLLWYDCVSCNEDFCGDCESSGKITVCRGSDANQGCFESVCHTCDANTFYYIYTDCMVCDGRWCDECWHAFDGDGCYGEHGGCDATVCGACAEASKRKFFQCYDCQRCSCTVCGPELRWAVCRFCGHECCAECDPGMRPIVDTLVDGLQVRPFSCRARESDACCPTCEVTEFICA